MNRKRVSETAARLASAQIPAALEGEIHANVRVDAPASGALLETGLNRTKSKSSPQKKEECGEISAKRSQAGAKGGKKSSQIALQKKAAQWEARLKKLHLTENAGRPQNSQLLYEGDTRKGFDFSEWASDLEEKTKAARENGEWPISLT